MAVEIGEAALKAGTEAFRAANEKCKGMGAKLQKDFRGDAAFPCEDRLGAFAKEAEAMSNTVEALSKSVESSAAEIESLQKDRAELIVLVKDLTGQRDMLLKGFKPCAKCLAKGEVNGASCAECKGIRFVKPKGQ